MAPSIILQNGNSSPTLKTLPSMVLQQETGWKMQKSQSDSTFPRPAVRTRGYSDSRARDFTSSLSHPLSRVTPTATMQPETLAPAATVMPSSSFASRVGDAVRSSFRDRSSSVSQSVGLAKADYFLPSPSGNPGCWWSPSWREVKARPWNDLGETESTTIPEEQKENWEQTRKTVSQAVGSILGSATVFAHQTLLASVPFLELVPIPGLTMAAKILLNIWDAVQEVDTNRLVFLRLAERCACIVITLNQELQGAGEAVFQELSPSLRRIETLFTAIHILVKKEGNIPFLKRYLKREETLRHIEALSRQLDQELQVLGPSFQIRTVKVIKEFAAGMDDRIESAIQRALQNHCCSQPVPIPGLTHSPRNPSLLRPSSRRLLQPLEEINSVQDDKDRRLDQSDLRQQIDKALQSGSDSTMLEFLQIPREDILEAIKSMQRYLERTRQGTKGAAGLETQDSKDILEREFIETGIDSLRRMSKSSTSLPSWTITRFEIDCTNRVGVGFFSDVYEGTWRGQTVAIKILRDFTSSLLFVREVEIWKNLSHPNIVELLGASSASGNPPWFFVSPFAEHGDLGDHLRRLSIAKEQRSLCPSLSHSSSSTRTMEHLRRDSFRPSRESDLHRFMLEIAMGMDYLHEHGVFHGDLKCANVLVDERYTCLISDFGQSEIRAEAYRMSGICGTRGTLRWQAPEVLQGLSELTPAVDVYAYAISCIEVLSMGQMPWGLVDDNTVQFIVLKQDERPTVPSQFHATPIHNLLKQCWHRDPESRPSFSEVVISLRRNRHSMGGVLETPPPRTIAELPELEQSQRPRSPISLSPCLSTIKPTGSPSSLVARPLFRTADSSPYPASDDIYSQEEIITESSVCSDLYSASPNNDSSSTFLSENSAVSEEFVKIDMETDPKLWEAKNERRYRMSLTHRYHHSLSLALWEPVSVAVGAVGYVIKPVGSFRTLFNAINPSETEDPRVKSIPSIAGYGRVPIGSHRHATRNAALRGLDAVVGFLSSGKRDDSNANISRRASFPLRAGHKVAYMYTESTEYRYMRELDAAKAWFQANADRIIEEFGAEHNLHREDLLLIIGVLQAPNYALFVSHNHPDGNVHFHTFSHRHGKPWGTFTTDSKASNEHGGPSYHEASPTPHQCAYKVSVNGGPPKAMLLARLRFPTDTTEPTSL